MHKHTHKHTCMHAPMHSNMCMSTQKIVATNLTYFKEWRLSSSHFNNCTPNAPDVSLSIRITFHINIRYDESGKNVFFFPTNLYHRFQLQFWNINNVCWGWKKLSFAKLARRSAGVKVVQ